MILLASTSDLLRIVTSQAVNTDVHTSWVDLNGTTVTPGRTNTAISTATTTTVVGSPGSSTYRTVKTLAIRNKHASTTQDVTVVHTDGTTAVELMIASLAAGECLHYDEHAGFSLRNQYGQLKTVNTLGQLSPTLNSLNTVTLSSDVVNNNGSANTIADVTGLSFSVNAGEVYWFQFNILYDSALTTTGSRWSVNGPTYDRLIYTSEYSLAATTTTRIESNISYDLPAASNTSSSKTAGCHARIEGFIEPNANGTLIARFASEVSGSAITAKAGSMLRWMRTK
jgi:hypothetical protein